MNRSSVVRAILLVALVSAAGMAQADQSSAVLGWVEEVAVLNTGLILNAKIDTGADNSSINATDIEYFTHDGHRWVRFNIQDHKGAQIIMERPLVRVGQIKRKEGGYIERPVVTLGFCVAGLRIDAEVNLANRNHFKYPMLVGRSLMTRHFVVDPERQYVTHPVCAAA